MAEATGIKIPKWAIVGIVALASVCGFVGTMVGTYYGMKGDIQKAIEIGRTNTVQLESAVKEMREMKDQQIRSNILLEDLADTNKTFAQVNSDLRKADNERAAHQLEIQSLRNEIERLKALLK